MEKNASVNRPPIVTVLGHVDHGKTTLLDAIRKTNVASREVGGITQKIGAYTIETPTGHEITFIDTPGHAAFGAMRGRGAKVADIAVLVVAANEGVKPQTRESLSLIQEAGIPFIVALSKMDLGSGKPEQVKKELLSLGVSLEDQGGDVPVVPVSARSGEGIQDLLETITLVAEVHGLEGKPEDPLKAYVIESRQDARRGPVATVVAASGKISVGDVIRAESLSGKVRALTGDKGEKLEQILPGMAGEILGFNAVPPVGANVTRGGDEDEQKIIASASKADVDTSKRLSLILKADSLGSLEALVGSLPPDVGVLSSGIGDINQNDVYLSSSFKVPIVGFSVKVLPQVSELIQKEGITIKLFSLIYEALEWISSPGEATAEKEKVLGRAEIRAQFPYGKNEQIAGVMVTEGRVAKGDILRVTRNGTVVREARVKSLKQRTKTIDKVLKGGEGGILFRDRVDFKIGDVLESVK